MGSRLGVTDIRPPRGHVAFCKRELNYSTDGATGRERISMENKRQALKQEDLLAHVACKQQAPGDAIRCYASGRISYYGEVFTHR